MDFDNVQIKIGVTKVQVERGNSLCKSKKILLKCLEDGKKEWRKFVNSKKLINETTIR